MNRFLKVFYLLSFAVFIIGCKKDDGDDVAPPRDFTEQYTTERIDIENYLKSHYIASVSQDFDIVLQAIPTGGTQTSIWDQTEYPLMSRQVKSLNTNDPVEYTVYYLTLNEGTGNAPTRYDNVLASYSGTLLNGTQFDVIPFPQNYSSLGGFLGEGASIEGWQEIIPLFKSGTYIDNEGPDPAAFEGFGAGVMFIPSALAYYNSPTGVAPAYSTMIFSFKLFAVQYVDNDGDGVLTKDETADGIAIASYDTDGDGIANYLDSDDDGDRVFTKDEILDVNGNTYPFDQIPVCPGGTLRKHLDPSCQ